MNQQIDHRVIKLAIGLIAVGLAFLLQKISGTGLHSISESYHYRSRDVFVGSLFAVGFLFLSFRGQGGLERVLSAAACLLALVVATAPCVCGRPPHPASALHFPAAVLLFAILGYFCWKFRARASEKFGRYPEARRRAGVYSLCLGGMTLVLAMALVYAFAHEAIDARFPDYVFWTEALGLVSFGVSWLAASKTLPLITNERERYRIGAGRAPEDDEAGTDPAFVKRR